MAEFCALSDNIALGCGDDFPLAGIRNIYIAPVRQVDMTSTTFSNTAHAITAIALKSAGKFVKLEARVNTKDVTTENAKDAGGNVFTVTANAVVPNIDKDKSFMLEQLGKQKLVAIIELNEKVTTNQKAIVIGLDNKMGNTSGVDFAFNPTVEAEAGALNAYNCIMTAIMGESPRFFAGTITVEDGSTGEAITLG